MNKPDWIDAKYEVVRDTRRAPRKWNGVGIPPQWREWGWFPRLVFVVVYAWLMWWVLMVAIEARAIVPLLLR